VTADARVEVDGGRLGIVLLGRDRMVMMDIGATAAMHIRGREESAGSIIPPATDVKSNNAHNPAHRRC